VSERRERKRKRHDRESRRIRRSGSREREGKDICVCLQEFLAEGQIWWRIKRRRIERRVSYLERCKKDIFWKEARREKGVSSRIRFHVPNEEEGGKKGAEKKEENEVKTKTSKKKKPQGNV